MSRAAATLKHVYLRNPGRFDDAQDMLRRLMFECGNCESAYNAFDGAQKAYLNWVGEADGQLRSLFVDPEPADGLTSRSFWEIQRLNDTIPGAWQVLRRELKAQSARLQEIQHRLAELKEFADRPGHLVVVDTSALVQGEWFEHVDWSTLLDIPPHIRIVIPIVVVEELDELKDLERRNRAGDRSRRVLRRLRDLGSAHAGQAVPIRDKVTVEVLLDDDWHQRRPNHDGEIIDQAKRLTAATGRPVRLVCVDASMEFRARQHGLTVTEMPTPANNQTGDAQASEI